jgi:YgiT-type zinc finger domain-containing protein
MANAVREENIEKCTIEGCPGDCEARLVTHTVRHNGRLVVIDRVPADVCTVCGDVLFSPDTVRHIEELLRTAGEPAREVPLYNYA